MATSSSADRGRASWSRWRFWRKSCTLICLISGIGDQGGNPFIPKFLHAENDMQKRIIILGVGITGLVLVALCVSAYYIFIVPKPPKPAEVELGPNIPLPDNPIVFTVYENHPLTTLGFINPDGSNFN